MKTAGFTRKLQLAIAIALGLGLSACDNSPPLQMDGPTAQWPHVGGNQQGQRFSPLTQVTLENVDDLQVAWTYRTGDVSSGNERHGPTTFQATPLVVADTLYFCTPYNRVIALDANTGDEYWTFDPEPNLTGVYTPACRGVAWWPGEPAGAANASNCKARIFTTTLDARLIALDAVSGEACTDFGNRGEVSLLNNLGDVRTAEYYPTSAPLVINDLVVTGASVQDGQRVDAPPGVVRAFDARSGELRWAWEGTPPGQMPVSAAMARAGADFTRATPNVWGNMSADPERNVVYLPTGNSQPDHYGGRERGDMDYYGTSVVALDADTGKRLWHFQTVHHDIWDWDVAAQPVSFTQATANGSVAGVIAATKAGHIFLLDADSGEPLFPVEERPVPRTTVPGEFSSPTQPFPTLPKPVHPPTLTEDDIWGIYPGDRAACLELFRSYQYEGLFTPPALGKKTLAWPGIGGGINWGSVSINPTSNIMLVNSMRVPYTLELALREQVADLSGADQVGANPQEGTPYVILRGAFLSPNNTPCTAPPWGVLTAIDLNSGATLWERPLGNLEGLAPLGLGRFFNWGTPNTGGSLQTASGLAFIGATLDGYFRAFDISTGKEVWHDKLPAPAQATPMTWRSAGGRQYIAIASGGHGPLAYAALGPERLGEMLGDTLVVYALPAPD
ncbi:pyrroloquinoline quinone-dependent dehydrogenase [Halieaceae bacterium IMCC14734]|uniref:Pyrroloquinoline quinone-dependent dehydrogenase n=1 Tax=Candidatus Litorirhabdus singularis TaxID=2518993 RepID=A0ABT3TIZ9_9GAMM|nr:pyrroloquinoline quinone-dependent dehydrogenase [Candidatus Litorirhabdus singularis]MCX2982302.1 pyrroloquinoline quinone-dependent dehydrogenase [Candidatus Litorirhabdus singularis]